MYTRQQLGKELKIKIAEKSPIQKIGEWAFKVYWENIEDIDLELENMLLSLNTMELGPEFEYSYEELEKIANALIEGKEVVL